MEGIVMEKERYEEVVYQYSDMVTRIAVMNVKNYDDAKDCYQNVFMKLYCYNKKFESEEHLKAWLIRVTINECKDYQKQQPHVPALRVPGMYGFRYILRRRLLKFS